MANSKHQTPSTSTRPHLVFLAGLPRTGSTLLTSILSQNPDVHVGTTSPLVMLMLGAKNTCQAIARDALLRSRQEGFEHEWLTSIPSFYYRDVKKQFIIDKNRAWTRDSMFLRFYITPTPRILVMLRPITEIVKSFIRVNTERGDALPERNLLEDGDPLLASIQDVGWALSSKNDDYFFVTYEQLITDTQKILEQISNFWHLPEHSYQLDNIQNPTPENDDAVFTRGLHVIKPQITRPDYQVRISKSLWSRATDLDDALRHDYEQAKRINPARFATC